MIGLIAKAMPQLFTIGKAIKVNAKRMSLAVIAGRMPRSERRA